MAFLSLVYKPDLYWTGGLHVSIIKFLSQTKTRNMKKNLYLLLVALSCMAITSCSSKDDTDTSDGSGVTNATIPGNWKRTATTGELIHATFHDNGTLDVSISGLIVVKDGFWSIAVTKNTLLFFTTDCGNGNTEGAYFYSITGNQMTLTLKSDACSGRAGYVPGLYTKQD
jgi:hypothetical protein